MATNETAPKKTSYKNFKTLAIINGTLSRPIIRERNEKLAREKFFRKYPGATLHECKAE